MYLGGKGIKFDMSILVGKTNTYTVEFWFKADTQKFKEVTQERTFLFMMNGRAEGIPQERLSRFAMNVMAIYVENGELKCAPFGFDQKTGELKDPTTVLTYTGVNPLTEEKWQHITCIYLQNKYVKGQYLAINLESQDKSERDIANSDFKTKILSPKTFAKHIYKFKDSEVVQILNESAPQRWNVILGNNVTVSASFYGSFKDVRLWKSTRSDAELYSNRFNQVENQDDLEGNLKFMDGSQDVYNSAESNTNGPVYPKNEAAMKLLPTDLSNIICAPDTYFNPENQKCTRYPFTKDPSIVYMVVNNVQHGHKMIIERLFQSDMTLPGEKFQPKTKTKWSVANETVAQKYFRDGERDSYELDPIFMGDYKSYQFQINVNDFAKHNFFLFMQQVVIPRKCLQVVDKTTGEPRSAKKVILDEKTNDLTFVF